MKRVLFLMCGLMAVFGTADARSLKKPAKPSVSTVASFDVAGGSVLEVPAPDPVTVTIWLQNETHGDLIGDGENLQYQYETTTNGCGITTDNFCGPLLAANHCTTHLYDPMPCNSTTVAYGMVRIKSPAGYNLKVHGDLLVGYQFGGNAPRDIWRYTITRQ